VRALTAWLILLVLAVLNGTLRVSVLQPWIGEERAHIVSTLILCTIIFLVAFLTISWIGARTRSDALLIGIFWVSLTFAFEFLAGHYLFGNSWKALLRDYNVFEGRVWILILFADLLAPIFTWGLQRI
jgi:hypothetical protein